MKQALKVVEEIKSDYKAIINCSSPYLKKDREKHIRALKSDLKEYCYYKKIDYKKLCKKEAI